MLAIALAVLAAVFIGSGDFLGGILGRRDRTPAAQVAVFGLMLAVSLPLAAVLDAAPPQAAVGWSVGIGVCWLLGSYALMLGVAEGKVTIVVPIAGVVSVAIPVVVDIVRGIHPSIVAGIGVAVAVLAVALVGIGHDANGSRSRPWSAAMGFVGGVATGLGLTFLNQATGAGLWPVVVASMVAVSAAVVVLAVTRRRIRIHRGGLAPALGASLLFFASFVALLAAFEGGNLTTVAVIASQYPVVTIALVAAIWKQRPGGIQYLGVVLAMVSVALITVGS